jgi:Xaa-Pro aminopeptidase
LKAENGEIINSFTRLLNYIYKNMAQTINQRIDALRALLKREGIDAFIIPSTDPHLSEYVAPYWKSREWISGFTGSAGTAVITSDKAGLWTDSRYFLQAEQQLEGSGIDLYKEMLPETPSILDFLRENLTANSVVGIDGKVFSTTQAIALQEDLAKNDITVKSIADPMNEIWTDRPPMPEAPAFIHEMKYAGKSCPDKLAAIRREMKKSEADVLLVSALDEIAWTLNIRGNDVHCNPVVVSYLIINEQETHFFIQPEKVTEELSAYLEEAGVTIHAYGDTESFVTRIPDGSIMLDMGKTNYAVYSALPPSCRVLDERSPIALLKAVRNDREIAGIHAAMQRDGVALVKFLKWLEEAVPAGNETEISVDKKLHEFRAAQPLYMGESFDTIAGYKEHGAIVHYEATPATDVPLKPEGFLLLDSGAQYLDGTTDITRTIALGPLTDEEKRIYTLVLRGHIQLGAAKFLHGCMGENLDMLARTPLWEAGLDFNHGTGHGVGFVLGVHEGPERVHWDVKRQKRHCVIEEGMIFSNEPGIYLAGKFGVRIENLVVVREAEVNEYGRFLALEPLTLVPYDRDAIDLSLLSSRDVELLNAYHAKVFAAISPYLSGDELEWLKAATEPVQFC